MLIGGGYRNITAKVQKGEVYVEGIRNDITESGIPIWERYMLTIGEAAEYYHIGEAKIRCIVDSHPNAGFAILNGNRVLIKRIKFEQFLDEATTI